MSLTRRRVLLGTAAAFAFGLSTTSCSRLDFSGNQSGFPDPDEVTDALRALAKEAGRETFQSVRITDTTLDVGLLAANGDVQRFSHDSGGWREGKRDQKSLLTPTVSVGIAELPLARLPSYLDAAGSEVDSMSLDVDYVGKIRVTARMSSDAVGLKLDGTGTVPELDPEDVADVNAAAAEMVAGYGTRAERVGSFNGFVHVDANVAGTRPGVRIIRYPRLTAQAVITQETPFSTNLLFDPRDFDPTTAVTRKATIAEEAHVEGRVWDWEYRRPPKGGDPLVSYGIGPKGPSTRVWLDRNGKIAAVTTGRCPKDSGFCPQ